MNPLNKKCPWDPKISTWKLLLHKTVWWSSTVKLKVVFWWKATITILMSTNKIDFLREWIFKNPRKEVWPSPSLKELIVDPLSQQKSKENHHQKEPNSMMKKSDNWMKESNLDRKRRKNLILILALSVKIHTKIKETASMKKLSNNLILKNTQRKLNTNPHLYNKESDIKIYQVHQRKGSSSIRKVERGPTSTYKQHKKHLLLLLLTSTVPNQPKSPANRPLNNLPKV